MDLGEEISTVGERFQIEELIFLDPVHGFDITLIGMSGWRDTHMLAVTEGFGKVAFEFAAVVGLPDQIPQRDTVTIQVLLDAGSEDGAGSCPAFFGKRPEQQTATNLAGGVLDDG